VVLDKKRTRLTPPEEGRKATVNRASANPAAIRQSFAALVPVVFQILKKIDDARKKLYSSLSPGVYIAAEKCMR
jgi:hypothetical protein